jgi:hypothetical protein
MFPYVGNKRETAHIGQRDGTYLAERCFSLAATITMFQKEFFTTFHNNISTSPSDTLKHQCTKDFAV